jgi:hypothetical protein
MTATAADGQRGIFGDTLFADVAAVRVHVTGGAGQALHISRDGLPSAIVPITSNDFIHAFTATRVPTSGPLGTFWRVDTFDLQSVTAIGNPIFLADPASRPGATPVVETTAATDLASGARTLPATGGGVHKPVAWGLLAAAGALVELRRRAVRVPPP